MAGGSSTRFSSEAHLRIGRWLRSKWHLDSLIAIGGMASVYAGTHRNGARAAIKVLHAQYTRNDQARRRFLAEGYAANKVGHRNAVSVLDDDTTEDGEVYLVMELLEGESFEGRLDRVGVMNPIEVLQIADQMLEVLACAHNRGILHRDIKPANIYLCRDGSVKVLDFGLARVRELSAEALDQSDGIVFGTVSYIAPEQARADNQNLDARSDMWSVAATMFRALTGETVFPAEGPVIERLLAVARKPARSIATLDPRLPRPVIELVDRALAFDPKDRWPSTNVMRAIVQDVIAQLEEDAEAAAASEQDEPLFSHRLEPGRPRTDPTLARPQGRPRTDPAVSGKLGQDPTARPMTPPLRPEPTPTPVPSNEGPDEIDLDFDNLPESPKQGKRARTRTLLTKEGRAELRRILDSRRESLGIPGGKSEATPEPVEAPVQATRPDPGPAVQPRPRVTTEPSPVAQAQPVPRVTTQPSAIAPPADPSASESFIGVDVVIDDPSMMQSSMVVLDPEEPSMLQSSMVVLQPEESIIEVTIQHTRHEPVGTIAEPIGEAPARPGPADSLTTAAFPAIGGPRPASPVARPPVAAVQPVPEDRSVVNAEPAKATASYPAIGSQPAKSTASYPAIGAPPTIGRGPARPTPEPTRSEETKIGPAPLAPPSRRPSSSDVTKVGAAPVTGRPSSSGEIAAKPAEVKPAEVATPEVKPEAKPAPVEEAPKVAAVPVAAPGAVRPDEPAGEVTKVARIPLPTFARPGASAPTSTPVNMPGPLPSRSSGPTSEAPRPSGQPAVSGEIGESRTQANTSGRWAPPASVLPTRPSGEVKPTNVTTGPMSPATSSSPTKAGDTLPNVGAAKAMPTRPASETSPTKATSEAPPSSTRPTSEAGRSTPAPSSPRPSVSAEPTRPSVSVEAKPVEAKPSKPVEAKPVEAQPSKPVEAQPGKPVEAKPGKPVEARPVEARPSKPIEGVKAPTSAKPSEPMRVPTSPVKPVVKADSTIPAAGEAKAVAAKSVEEAKAVAVKPGEETKAVAATKSGDEAKPAKPLAGPGRSEPAKAGTSTKPGEPAKASEATKPGASKPGERVAPVKSGEAKVVAPGKPGEAKAAKPEGEARGAGKASEDGKAARATAGEARGAGKASEDGRAARATAGDAKAAKANEAEKARELAGAKAEVKPEPAEVKPAEVKPAEPEPVKEEAKPAGEPTPDPLRLPGAGLSRPTPTKSVFSVPYAGLGKTDPSKKK